MASQANVYTSVSAQAWFTDKCQISTGNTAVTYNVALAPGFTDTIFSNAVQIGQYESTYVYVGVGNQLTITGINFTAQELGSQTSGSRAVRQPS
jgi:hypothetical protein